MENWTGGETGLQERVSNLVLNFIIVFSVPIFTLLALYNFMHSQLGFMAFFIAIAAGLTAVYLQLRKGRPVEQMVQVSLALLFAVYFLTVAQSDMHTGALYWAFALPLIVVILTPVFWTLIWLAVLLIGIIAPYAMAKFGLFEARFDSEVIAFFIIANAAIALLTYYIKELFIESQISLTRSKQALEMNKRMIDQKIPIVRLGFDCSIQKPNQAFCELTGYSEKELTGKSFTFLKLAELGDLSQNHDFILDLCDGNWHGELYGHKRNGKEYWVKASLKESYDSQFKKDGMLMLCEDVTDHQLLERQANYDQLTGVYNRRMFDELTRRAIMDFQRYREPICLLITDIDHFKRVNDEFGHHFGDEILKGMAEVLSANLRKTDTVARWGGEEFAVLLPKADVHQAHDIADKLRRMIEKEKFYEGFHITASFGVTELRIDESADDWFRRADSALYDAKESGRNRVCFA
ncbi:MULTISPECIES: sensor domain-containing diguanylate cyclase [Thiomicrorhabdus]|uniref:diguanylate cyclase n=1 Tax=Thiomicrorhabdus heinhorstiae TaxID=2748010 RepID=A0ABS0BVM0_9GAMM|nr:MULTISPECIES: sensor domain-containing diguanylate cyclase [Thiomicrorhabdus]MBF6057881.1 diguanylate cyclase [Thiomicrorhabdus heinhorstiae]